MMMLLKAIRNPLYRGIHSYTQDGQAIMTKIKERIKNKEYREALVQLNEFERTYPEYFKATFVLRGEARIGLARELHLIENEHLPEPNSAKIQPK